MTTFSSPSQALSEPLQDTGPSSLLAELYGTNLPGAFQLQGLANPCLTPRPPGSIDLVVGNYPPGMCGSSAFDDALRSLGDDLATFMSNPTADELLAAISMPAPQENDDPLSSGSAATMRCRRPTLTSTRRTLVVPY